MKKTRLTVLALLTVLICAFAFSALAATPTLSVNSGANQISGVEGRFTGAANIQINLSGADTTAYPVIDLRIKLASPANSYTTLASVTPSANGGVAVSIPAATLNGLPLGTNAILASSPGNNVNDPIAEITVGTITVTAAPYTVYIQNTEGGAGFSQPTTAAAGEEIFINVNVEKGYYFVRWEIVSGNISLRAPGVPNLVFTMPASDVKLRAVFRSNTGDSTGSSGSSTTGDGTTSEIWSTNTQSQIPTYTPALVTARATPVTGTVTADTQIRTAPTASAGTTTAGSFVQGDSITVIGYSNDYFAVLVGTTTMGYIDASNTNVTFDPAVRGTVRVASGAYSVGTTVQVTGRSGADWLISAGGQTGTLPGKAADGTPTLVLNAEDLTAIAANYTFPAFGDVRDGGVNVRESASTSSRKLGAYREGTTFEAVGYQSNFFIVERNTGEVGYIVADYTNITLSPPIYGTLLQNTAAYSRANTSSSYFVETLTAGAVVSLQGREGAWWRVTVNGKENLYIRQQYVNVPTVK